jgi:uncharacterized protein involved in exopolysaccharide biosynthesis
MNIKDTTRLNDNSVPIARNHDGDISLVEIVSAIIKYKFVVVAITGIFTFSGIGYAISLPNLYHSEALLSVVSEQSALKVPGQLGGLAALAGINVGNGSGDNTNLALEVLKSRDFLGKFIEKYDLFIPLMAAKGWSRETDTLIIDPEIYDEKSNHWVRSVSPPYKPKPSLIESHAAFLKILTAAHDIKTQMVKISIEHYSPVLAKEWVSLLVKELNNEMRRRDVEEAERSIAYLNEKIKETNIADIRVQLFSLVEEQMQKLMIANVRDEYVFKTVDQAIVPEEKAKPKRALMVILAAMFGFILSVILVIVRYFFSKK